MNTCRKVVHVMRRFSPEQWGGTESVVLHLSKAFQQRGIDSQVFCTDMLSEPGRSGVSGVPVRRFRSLLPWLGLSRAARRQLMLKGGNPLSLPLFFALLFERDLSVVHAHVQHRLGGMARTVARLRGLPFVVSLHGGYFTLPPEEAERMTAPFRGHWEWGRVFGWLFGARRVLNDADAVVCVGQSEYEEVKRRYPFKNVVYLPNGVEVDQFASADGALFRRSFGLADEEKLVLCVSRIDPQKDQLTLLQAFAESAATRPDWRLVLLGPTSVEAYREQLEEEIARLGLRERVLLPGGLSPDDPLLPAAYRAADLVVLPSVHEPFGIVVLEAWAAGVPVVASRVGGIPGFAVDGETARLFEPGDRDGLSRAMNEVLENGPLRDSLSGRAFELVSAEYDWSTAADKLLALYEHLMSR